MQASFTAKPLTAAFTFALIGISVGVAAAFSLTILRPAVLAFGFGGLILLLPTIMVREPITYWQFLFVLSFLVDVSKRLTSWLVSPPVLSYDFGYPASGTLSIDIYVTDIILFVMLVPWIVQLCRRRTRLYFPIVAHIFVLYLAWALIVSLIEAKSLYLSIFEWVRELLYFVSFIYIINNVIRRSHIRAIALGLMVALAVASLSVIGTYAFKSLPGNIFAGVYQKRTEMFDTGKGTEKLSTESSSSQESGPHQRSAGIFVHPAHAAYYFEYILPVVLGYFLTRRRIRDRLLFGGLVAMTCVATYLTFSRAGLVGLFAGVLFFFPLAGWSGLISRRTTARWLFIFGTLIAVASPLLVYSLLTRSETITKRIELNERALATIAERPILGGGLNNSSAVMKGTHDVITTAQGSDIKIQIVHNYYLIVMIEVGLVGFLLFFTFFGQTAVIGIRHLRAAELELKILLAGTVSGLVGVAVHNLADPFGAHQAVTMLWLYAGFIIALCRRVRVEQPPAVRARGGSGAPALAPGPIARSSA